MPNVLIVDDEADIRELIGDILQDEGYQTRFAGNASEALKQAEIFCPDAVILDIWLEGSKFDGIGVLKKLKIMYPSLPVIMISGHGNIETAVKTIRSGAYDFIEKPFKAEKLIILLDRAISTYLLIKENLELKKINEINSTYIGNSKPIIGLLNNALKVASSNSRIIITGEQGTGKEVLARFIHSNSLRQNRPFIVMHAATVKEETFENEFFGNKKFINDSLLEKVNGGALFIDEVSELPLKVQDLFLKILQESGNAKKYDIRIIASSSRDLSEEISNGKLNQSFYYRINIVSLNIPSLRERKADISILKDFFLKEYTKGLGLTDITLSKQAEEILEIYDWPGNIRQLKNVIEGLLIMHGKHKTVIEAEDLPSEINPANHHRANKINTSNISSHLILQNLKDARDNFEKEYLAIQLKRFSGNISHVAKFIGMERTALYRKIKLLGLEL